MNPNFNCAEFDIIKSQAGLNRFRLSAKEWTEKTNAIGIISKAGRYGGTYAHKDIAFEFTMWISPEFKVYLIREFQRLKGSDDFLRRAGCKGISSPAFNCEWSNIFLPDKKWKKLSSHNLLTC